MENRRYIIGGSVILVLLIFMVRLFYLQIIESDYKVWADSNAFLKKSIYPSRGVIYDRKGELLVYNQPTYDVMMIMREVQPFDTLDFCNILGITKEKFINRISNIKNRKINPGYSSYTPQLFMGHLGVKECGVLQEKFYKFPGFFVQSRTLRKYNYPNAAHVLGNIGEVNPGDIEKDSYYVGGDYAGRSGVEASYEKILRGTKGAEILLRDAHGRIQGHYDDGRKDIEPVSGRNLTLSIDIELQALGEDLMKNKKGSIVMIEPSTGEILCLVSSPSYEPDRLAGRKRGEEYFKLQKSPDKPLLNRAIMGYYPPGSTFKPTQGLIFLEEKVITADTKYPCAYGYTYLNGKPACHGHLSPLNLDLAIATSCNSFFCWGLHDMIDSRARFKNVQEGFEVWKNYIVSMGYGYKLGVDLPGEKRGFIPNSKYYDKYYNKRWNSSTIISIAIGQGEILATPLQICNLSATIANRGYYITPHVVRKIQDIPLDTMYTNRQYTMVNSENYEIVAKGMRDAVLGGTCMLAALPDIEVCGKTGTAENPHGKDHSAFIGFAPYRNPKVAICVYVENGGFGKEFAVPIGKLMMEKYLKGEISEENKVLAEIMRKSVVSSTFVSIPYHELQ